MRALWVFTVIALFAAPSMVWGKIGGGDIDFRVSGAPNVMFSHDVHVGRLGVKCGECHYKIYTTSEGHQKSTMADMQKGRSCGVCHNGKKAFDVKTRCEKCHS